MSFVQTAFGGVARAARRNRFESTFLAAFFVVMSILAGLFPRSGDDWAWGSQLGLDRLHAHFHNYNGRYAGDLAIIALTRMSVLAPILVAASIAVTIFLILDLTDNRSIPGYLLTVLLFLLMPLETWRESVVWLSGYSNYGVAGLCLLVFLWAAKREWTSSAQDRKGSPAQTGPAQLAVLAAIVVFGFVAALFMEHVTLYLVAASLLFVVGFRVRFGRVSLRSIAWAASFVVGAAVMFSNSAYRSATTASTKDKPVYQQIHTSKRPSLHDLIAKAGDTISSQAVTHNVALNLVVILLACLLTTTAGAQAGRARVAVLALAGLYLAIATTVSIAEKNVSNLRLAVRLLNGVAAAVLLAILVLCALFLVADVGRRAGIVVCCASVLLLLAPLTLVDPVGPRCFYPTYLLFLVLVNLLVKEVAPRPDGPVVSRVVPFLGVLVAGVLLANLVIYGVEHHAAATRLATIRHQVDQGATSVTVKRLPFRAYVHFPDPITALWVQRYKAYYHLPAALQIKVKGS